MSILAFFFDFLEKIIAGSDRGHASASLSSVFRSWEAAPAGENWESCDFEESLVEHFLIEIKKNHSSYKINFTKGGDFS